MPVIRRTYPRMKFSLTGLLGRTRFRTDHTTLCRHFLLFPAVRLAYVYPLIAPCQGLDGPPKFLCASLCTCHSLMTPEILHTLAWRRLILVTSVYVKTLVDPNWYFEAVPTFRCCEQPTACTILCVRFTHFVRLLKLAFFPKQTSAPPWAQHSIQVGG